MNLNSSRLLKSTVIISLLVISSIIFFIFYKSFRTEIDIEYQIFNQSEREYVQLGFFWNKISTGMVLSGVIRDAKLQNDKDGRYIYVETLSPDNKILNVKLLFKDPIVTYLLESNRIENSQNWESIKLEDLKTYFKNGMHIIVFSSIYQHEDLEYFNNSIDKPILLKEIDRIILSIQ